MLSKQFQNFFWAKIGPQIYPANNQQDKYSDISKFNFYIPSSQAS